VPACVYRRTFIERDEANITIAARIHQKGPDALTVVEQALGPISEEPLIKPRLAAEAAAADVLTRLRHDA
jgi:hypothetical protein